MARVHALNLQPLSFQSRYESTNDDANATLAKLISRFLIEAKEAFGIVYLLLVWVQRTHTLEILVLVLEPDDPRGDLSLEVADQRAKAALRGDRIWGQAKIWQRVSCCSPLEGRVHRQVDRSRQGCLSHIERSCQLCVGDQWHAHTVHSGKLLAE